MTSNSSNSSFSQSGEPLRHLSFGPVWLSQVLRWGKRSSWLTLLLWLAAVAPAWAGLELRVAIEQDVSQIKVGSSTDATIVDPAGNKIADVPAMNAVMAEAKDGKIAVSQVETGGLWVEPSGDGFVFIGDKWYRGRTLVVPTSGGLTAVNYVDIEQYLYSVVGSEMPTSWAIEALKAQSVAARSYVLYQRQASGNAVYDVGDTTRWQVYGGVEKEAASTRAAVDATQGQVVTYQGNIIDAVFHSCAGGRTENVEDVWTRPLPYLRAVDSPDLDAPNCQWEKTVTVDELEQHIPEVGQILAMNPAHVTAGGRITQIQVVGDEETQTIDGDDLRDDLGLRSAPFNIIPILNQVASTSGDVASTPTAFQLTGRGFGHGIGMSQWGAYGFAQQGWNYAQILSHYYTGIALAKIEVQ